MLYKGKGDRADLDKYRGFCLLTIISRITAKVAVKRIARMLAEMFADIEERCKQKI